MIRLGFAQYSSGRVVLLLLFSCYAIQCSLTESHAGDIFTSTAPNGSNTSGLRLTVDVRGGGIGGDQPVYVRLHTTDGSPLTRDRSFEIELIAYFLPADSSTLETTIQFPKGANEASAIVAFPIRGGRRNQFDVLVKENGREHEDLRITAPTTVMVEQDTCWLWIHPQAARLGDRLPANTLTNQGDSSESVVPSIENIIANLIPEAQLQRSVYVLDLLHPSDVFDRWALYSCFSTIIISSNDLADIASDSPEQMNALTDWLRTGRTLIVDCFDDPNETARVIEQSFAPTRQFDRSTKLEDIAPNGLSRLTWYDTEDLPSVPSIQVYMTRGQSVAHTAQEWEAKDLLAELEDRSLVGVLGNGTIICCDREKSHPDVQRIVSSIAVFRGGKSKYDLVGYQINGPEARFGDWLIPGVGLPPVGTFRVLITLFVIVIGPVNYFVLRKLQRLYLLMVTVPLGAMLVCSALFVYAMFADGINVSSRVLSYTRIDQTTGNAASWSRHTYYSALAGSDGYRFPDDCEVIPLVADRVESRRYVQSYSDGWNHFRRGNTGTRTTSQFLVARSTKTDARVEVGEAASDASQISFVNRLGSQVVLIGIVDDNGNTYLAESIDDGKERVAESASQEEFIIAFSNLIRASTPANPLGYSAQPRVAPNPMQSNETYGFQAAGVLGDSILGVLSLDSIEPRSYWAVVRTSPCVVLGHESAREQASLHVVVGTW